MNINLDQWQKDILEAKGNLCICTGRQVGKSTVISIKASEFIAHNWNKSVMIISSTERQAEELFIKCLNYLDDNYKKLIKQGKDRPTKHVINLTNGSIIRSLPCGLAGTGIRGFTLDMLIVDEAAYVPDAVFSSLTPSLLTTKGDIILISTPHGRQGYFYQSFNDPTYTPFHISSKKVIEERPVTNTWALYQRQKALDFLESEKTRMTKMQWAQEYGGEFVEKLMQFFPDNLIIKCMRGTRRGYSPDNVYFLGVDVAAKGKDESTFEIIDRTDRDRLIHVENIQTRNTMLTETTNKILLLESQYIFRKIYIDDGGIGFGVFDQLLNESATRRKVIPINNASRSLNRDDTKKTRLLKEDLYNNLLRLMEQDKIILLDDPEIFQSLKSVQYEYNDSGDLRIFGNYTHIAEGLIRACWCVQDKSLNIWVR